MTTNNRITLQRRQVILAMQEKLSTKAKFTERIIQNYREAWFKPDGSPLSDLDLTIRSLNRESTDKPIEEITDESSFPEERRGLTPLDTPHGVTADKSARISEILYQAQLEKNQIVSAYYSRQLDRETFGANLQSAITNLRRYLAAPPRIGAFIDKSQHENKKLLLEDLEYQHAEHLATPYADIHFPMRIPSDSREITLEQLQNHLSEMEKRK